VQGGEGEGLAGREMHGMSVALLESEATRRGHLARAPAGHPSRVRAQPSQPLAPGGSGRRAPPNIRSRSRPLRAPHLSGRTGG
jgi:hypothetical protein